MCEQKDLEQSVQMRSIITVYANYELGVVGWCEGAG